MAQNRQAVREIEELSTLKTLTRVYGEIATMKMIKTRTAVMSARDFLAAIGVVFDEVRASHLKEVESLLQKRRGAKGEIVTTLSHNGKKVAVLLSANTRLYGDVVQRTYDLFLKAVKSGELEVTIVGKVGQQLFANDMPTQPVTVFEYPDDGQHAEAMAELVAHLVQYEEIHVFHGKFVNVVRQEPEQYVLTAGMPLSEAGEKGEVVTSYLFEPSLEAILKYFEKEIFGTLFGQTLAESQLAKYGSRMTAMDRAEQNIEKRLKAMQMQVLKERHAEANRKQLNSMSSVLRRFGG